MDANNDAKNDEQDYGKLKEKNIDTRLEAVAASTSRSRKTFLIMTIFCASINIALWNGYLSWVRDMALPQEQQSTKSDSEKTSKLSNSWADTVSCFICSSPELKTFREEIQIKKRNNLNQSNNSNLANKTDLPIDSKSNSNLSSNIGFKADFQGTNVNGIVVGSIANINSNLNKNSSSSSERNRQLLIDEWIRSQTISINLLGIRLTTFDLAVLGSFSLFIMMFWLYFVFRRENRAIVPFLKEIYEESEKIRNEITPKTEEVKNEIQANELSNLVFHGIANNILFTDIARNDSPMKFVIFNNKKSSIVFERNLINTILSLAWWVILAILVFSSWVLYWNPNEFSSLFTFSILFLLLIILVSKEKTEKVVIGQRVKSVNRWKRISFYTLQTKIEKQKIDVIIKRIETILNENQNVANKTLVELKNYKESFKQVSEGQRDRIKILVKKDTKKFDGFKIIELQRLWDETREKLLKINSNKEECETINELFTKFNQLNGLFKTIDKKNQQISESILLEIGSIKEEIVNDIKKLRNFLLPEFQNEPIWILNEKNESSKKESNSTHKTFKEKIIKRLDNNNEETLVRYVFDILLFLPSITILFIVFADIASLFDYSAYRMPDYLLIDLICREQPSVINKIIVFESIAVVSFVFTTYLSLRCKQFVDASSLSLNTFYEKVIRKNFKN